MLHVQHILPENIRTHTRGDILPFPVSLTGAGYCKSIEGGKDQGAEHASLGLRYSGRRATGISDPKDPSKLLGFESDIAEAIVKALGVRLQIVQTA